MYQIVVERSAEKDLKKLSSEVRPRAIAAIQALAKNPRPRAVASSLAQPPTGAFAWVTTVLCMKSPMKSASFESTACGIAGISIANTP